MHLNRFQTRQWTTNGKTWIREESQIRVYNTSISNTSISKYYNVMFTINKILENWIFKWDNDTLEMDFLEKDFQPWYIVYKELVAKCLVHVHISSFTCTCTTMYMDMVPFQNIPVPKYNLKLSLDRLLLQMYLKIQLIDQLILIITNFNFNVPRKMFQKVFQK